MRVIITGSTGFIGGALASSLTADGHEVVGVSRQGGDGAIAWDLDAGTIDAAALEGADAIVHLAGEPILGRWTKAKKRRLIDSRIGSTRLLASTIAGLDAKPKAFVCGSAIGIYGDRGDEELTEASPTPRGPFLADLCLDWEAEAAAIADHGVRVTCARTGLVLDNDGGALKVMRLIANVGANGPLGGGKQWWSWITLADEVAALRHLIEGDVEGPVNLTGPNPVRQKDFARALGRAMRRPSFMPAPGFAIKLVLGEMGGPLLLDSARVQPAALQASGFEFAHPDLAPALSRN